MLFQKHLKFFKSFQPRGFAEYTAYATWQYAADSWEGLLRL